MDIPKNGESSRLPEQTLAEPPSKAASSTELILPVWDDPPQKHLHASLDLISLLHLDGLYNTYVRPYFDPIPETDDEADAARPRAKKKQGLSKGYVGLIEDCIDPVPMGNQAEHSLLPLLTAAPAWEGPLVPITSEVLASARLEQGTRVEGYAGGEKLGVKEAEERRRRKKANRPQSLAPDLPDLPAGQAAAPGTPNPPPPRGPRTPFLPRGGRPGGTPVRPPFPRASAPPASGNYTPRAATPGGPGTPGARPGTPSRPPGFTLAPNRARPGTPSGLKRPAPPGEYPSVKRVKGGASRSASPATGTGAGSGSSEIGVKAVFKRRTEEPM